MAFLGSLVGANGTGLNFQAQSAPLQTPTTTAQAQQAYTQSQGALQQQQQFLQALQAQNGIQNQSNVIGQLQGVASGTGPNPATAQLAQSTQANTANQAALMAGQRGASANTGLIARQAAQQGAANQQNAVGQAAALQAQQQLGALGQLGGLTTQQVSQQAGATTGLNAASQGEQGQILGAIQGQNQAEVANTAQMNQANAAIQSIAAQQQGQLAGGLIGGVGSALGLAEGGMVPKKMAAGGPTLGVDTTLAPPQIPAMGYTTPSVTTPSVKNGPMSNVGKQLNGSSNNQQTPGAYQAGNTVGSTLGAGIKAAGAGIGAGVGAMANLFKAGPDAGGGGAGAPQSGTTGGGPSQTMMAGMAKGGSVPALVSPGERYLPPKEVKEVAKGKKAAGSAGEKIPGKPKVKGDSYANDTVHKNLSPGGIVIPNSIEQSPDSHAKAEEFVNRILVKQGLIGGKKKGANK